MTLGGFHPTIARWFAERLGVPTPPQLAAWPAIRSGAHVLLSAPTGSGKTLAGFLAAIDALVREGPALPDETRVLYVSPLKALANDVQKNLLAPLAELRARDPELPEVRVAVRSGDTPQAERAGMLRRPPHVLVTTPESLYILLTSVGGRKLLGGVRTVLVDEIHAVLGDKRGSHLALSLERLAALVERQGRREPQRIGLSATQKPLAAVAEYLGGPRRAVTVLDQGSFRALDLALELPPSPLETVCSHETWSEVYRRVSELVLEHRTTLVFVQTRKLAERVAAQLATLLGEARVTCHHSSLARDRRLAAEQRLKAGELSALVATTSLELGIDIGDVDLVCQLGTPRSIATFLQRVGRAGHGVGRTPKGRLFPLTQDELVEAAALFRALQSGVLDRTPTPRPALDVLAQQIVAECAAEPWALDALFERLRGAWPYRELARTDFDALVTLHSRGRAALLHLDGVNGLLRGTRRARLTAITCGGAIPDTTQYQVVLEPEGTPIGSVDEDFAIESSAGDVFQLGSTSWRILRVERGLMRVVDAHGTPPSLPFWIAEAPARTRELSAEVSAVREHGRDPAWLERETGIGATAAGELARYLQEAAAALGAMPTGTRLVLERFFDESGGAQLVLHAPLGGRINKALGLVLRKRFCRHFGFELQAAAGEDHVLLSLSPQHSFPLDEVFDYVRSTVARELLVQAVLVTPLFESRWRWNVARSLIVERFQGGKRVPPPLLRMRADDQLAQAFPDAVACGENLAPGDLAIPWEHPLVRQTLLDCLEEALDAEGLVATLRALEEGAIERVAIDTPQPSPLARAVLSIRPYGFLDDAPLEERRTQAVLARRVLDQKSAATLGALDPAAIEAVQREAWPDPRDAEELHEALSWMGWVETGELTRFEQDWRPWIEALAAAGRAVRVGERWYAAESTREPKAALRGRMEALGPVRSDDPLLFELEREGVVLRIPYPGGSGWCERRLLARIQRRTLEALRREIEPVSTADFRRYLAAWQHVDPDFRAEGPAGLLRVLERLSGFEAPAKSWERALLAVRVKGYRPEWLDQLALSGQIAWGRLFGSGNAPLRSAPIAFFPRAELESWLALATPLDATELSWPARAVLDALTTRGALFTDDLARATRLLATDLERGLGELVARGLVTSDSFASLRAFLLPAYRRKSPIAASGRWSPFRTPPSSSPPPAPPASSLASSPSSAPADLPTFAAHALLRRHGLLFRALLEKERLPIPWRDLARACRTLELRGELRGGRFVSGFAGEQFALPEAVTLLRSLRKRAPSVLPELAPADPLTAALTLEPGQRAALPARPTP
ncbi:MAG TPA: DEAD/DEAH box helicase [Planctomycetota bacterium]